MENHSTWTPVLPSPPDTTGACSECARVSDAELVHGALHRHRLDMSTLAGEFIDVVAEFLQRKPATGRNVA